MDNAQNCDNYTTCYVGSEVLKAMSIRSTILGAVKSSNSKRVH
jgi:hypothetical protein